MSAEVTTEQGVDLSDLDLLDDETRHARCARCGPFDLPPMTPFVALCGATGLARTAPSYTVPPNACPQCVDLYYAPCLRCGHQP